MISTLHIKNIGIIDELSINLNEGFNVLTGETGAGKTLIIDSLQILAGGRFSKEIIRNGENYSFVEMSLYLPEYKEYDDGNIVVSREVNINGKNLCKINGRLVSVSELKKFMEEIIDIHGQNENQSLLNTATHMQLLDDYSQSEIQILKEEYSELYEKYKELIIELKKNYGDDKEKERKLNLLSYEVNEIEEANLKVGEEEELEEKKTKIVNAEKIYSNIAEAGQLFKDVIVDNINKAARNVEKIEGFDKNYEEVLQRIKSVYYDVEEISNDLSSYIEDIEFDEEEQVKVEERLDLIHSLKRKYGNNISEILEYKEKIEKEIYEITNLDDYIKKLKKEKKEIESKMFNIASKMHEIRNRKGIELSEKINTEIKDLDMKNAKVQISVVFDEERKYTSNGLDSVEFLIATNIGEKAKPLHKIASGGEMSRIMLAIKTVLAEFDKVPVLIFDEIDTGISGIAANATSEKIKKISKTHQVICVTHLATIAAKGDNNFYISKKAENGKTKTNIKLLNEDETIKEIARIASGDITEIALEHARELRRKKEVA